MGEFGFNRFENNFLGGKNGLDRKIGIDKANAERKLHKRKKETSETKGQGIRSWKRSESKAEETKRKLNVLFDPNATREAVTEAVSSDKDSKTWKELDKLFVKPESEEVQEAVPEEPENKAGRRFVVRGKNIEELKN